MDRPTVDDLIRWLKRPLEESLGDRYGKLDASFLSQANSVADGTTVLRVRDSVGESRAVVICSAPITPDMVRHSMDRARQAKKILGPATGAAILEPVTEGSVNGLTYAILPYCDRLSDYRLLWWIQRTLLRAVVFEWLWQVTKSTVCDIQPPALENSFAEPLRYVATTKILSAQVRAAARNAIGRLDAGVWSPRQVLTHGDLWKGNILIRPAHLSVEPSRWGDRFVIIDWAGSEICGYAMYDLIRLAQSMRLDARSLRREVDRHCRLLRCEPADATSYLLAALGHIAMNLEHFPIDRYALIAESCYTTLARISD